VALLFAGLSAFCFGTAVVTSKFGLRHLDARSGAAISIPTAVVLFLFAAPFTIELSGFSGAALGIFALVGLFFPAFVTLLTFRSTELLGPTVTGAVSGTAPLFALPAAALFLGETISERAVLAALGVAAGIALLSGAGTARGARMSWLLIPLAGSLIRGTAQALAKAGLLLWPSPFAASLVAYVISSVTVVGVDRFGGRRNQRPEGRTIAWFMITGVLNGAAVLCLYMALQGAPVSTVAPVVASYPLVAAVLSLVVLHDEKFDARRIAGALVMVGSIGWLVAG
jgi:drug/metabolite transporter (DMT)-like permease